MKQITRKLFSLCLSTVLVAGMTATALAAPTEPKPAIPATYAIASNFSEGLAGVSKDGEKYGFIDKTGKEIIPFIYSMSMSDDFSEGLSAVNKDGKYGYIDKTGKEIIPFNYTDAWGFSDGLAAVRKGARTDQYGFIDKTGKEITPFIYTVVSGGFSEGLAAVSTSESKTGYIDTTGKVVIPFAYGDAGDFSEGLAEVKEFGEGDSGYIDKTGKFVVPYMYGDGHDFSDGLAAVYNDGKWGFIDTTGKVVIPLTYEAPSDFSEGLAPVFKDGKWGFIDKTGKVVIPFTYTAAWGFTEGLAMVYMDGKYGFIDKTGKEMIPCIYETLGDFSEGLVWARNSDGKVGYLANPLGTSGTPTTPTTPVAPANNAAPTASKVLVNGAETAFDAYNIGGNNYFKLRDVAKVVSGSPKQFEVTFDTAKNAIVLTSAKPYTAVGGEMAKGDGKAKVAAATTSAVLKDGAAVTLTAYNIGGNNYFKLRDLGSTFDFDVSFDKASGSIVIDTAASYTAD